MQGYGALWSVGSRRRVSESFGRRKKDKSVPYLPLHNRAVDKFVRHGVNRRLVDPSEYGGQ